ncbi:tRNA uridine(34) 5-carboxymethylaminomethyl modification radical SAM/GNAT enzyme Elp3 [Nitrosopumilus sp. K4]|uniref:tRNA uridine(34) 5-carboxymethylaminomethyl modification radical SAM/GNAT enzyme Elp3 n=1 Tax=Nitrosopumilus sp. K4 TaxID=2795383 RepID=UPI001BAC14EA|nr:tRNA uridine(34) 5-carboxymethylaminomethyl modification radical SAM/GNAT enzyme Elp3 [Nitrosopumilus sp. K4]QUC63899.1 tRNA uridine(34) 5-carboxymethylaminomethyl modification radical SAM/GNAT enzyme Elp3 [Nitrosopumilus sp. K4]
MSKLDSVLSKACTEITQNLLTINDPTKKQVKEEIKKICAKYSLERIPRNHEILSVVNEKDFMKLRKVLLKKPMKTASGVSVVALMPKPFACPHGRCTYCPGGIEFNSPNSYTGNEPSTINAIENNYDPKLQITSKIEKLIAFGHDPSKMEIVIVGGTFLFMPKDYQENFIKSCYDALNGVDSKSLEEAKSNNEHAKIRNVGFTIETKPDYCKQKHVDDMLNYGITRIEIGVQSLQERVYDIVNRGHNYNDVTESFQIAKDAGYKIVAHMMPGLPTVTPEEDISDFKKLFTDSNLKPDMLKIYPSLVIENTPMYDEYKKGEYTPYSNDEMIRVLTEVKKNVPKWVRIMRVQREISPNEIIAGPKSGNLRQIVHENLKKQGLSCRCIRCREAGLSNKKSQESNLKLNRIDYESSGGKEVFLSFEDENESIYGFLRLRKPSSIAHRDEVKNNCIVREIHVYGKSLKIGQKEENEIQHSGLGKHLMKEAENISKKEFDAKKLLVISAVGTREYYQKLGYSLYGPYMAKSL